MKSNVFDTYICMYVVKFVSIIESSYGKYGLVGLDVLSIFEVTSEKSIRPI